MDENTIKIKHTPAPWDTNVSIAVKMGLGCTVHIGSGSGSGGEICSIDIDEHGEDSLTQEDVANANLIAAAPELLEALEDIVKCEINRRKDLKALSKKPSELYTFSDKRVKNAQAVLRKAKGTQ